jgi:hypothetical protein
MLSFPITIVIKIVCRWRYSRCYMDEGVELRCFGTSQENGKFSDLTY